MPISSDREFTSAQAARRMSLTPSDVRELCNAGKLPGAIKRGSRWYIPESAINSWLQTQSRWFALDAPRRWERFRSQPWIFWPTVIISSLAGIVIFFFAAISAGADFGPFQEQLYQWQVIRRFAPRQEDQVLIIIAAFETGSDRKSGIQEDLWAAIDTEIKQLNLSNTRVEKDPTVIPANERQFAHELGERHNATVVIWGSDTDFRVQVEFLNLTIAEDPLGKQSMLEEERTRLASPPEYDSFISNEVRPLMTFFSLYAIGRARCCVGDYLTTVHVLERALDELPDNPEDTLKSNLGQVWLLLADAYAGSDNERAAMAAYTQAIATKPSHAIAAIAYNNRSSVYRDQRQYEEALADLNEAVRLGPDFGLFFNNRSFIYSKLGRYREALADLDEAIRLDPGAALYYNSRGVTYNDMARYKEALADFGEAIRLAPEFANPYSNRAFTFNALSQYQQAIADANKAVRLNPNLPSAYNERGFAYDGLGQYEQGIANYSEAIRLDPKYATAYNNRAYAYHELKQYQQAVNDASEAVHLDPEFASAYRNRGGSHFMLEQYQQALADFNKAIHLEPNYPDVYKNRGYVHYKLGQYEQARDDFIRYLKLDPHSTDRLVVEKLIDEIESRLNR